MKHWMRRFWLVSLVVGLVAMLSPGIARAQGAEGAPDYALAINTVWVLLTGSLVFFMQSGFAFLEAGSTRSKNIINTLLENFIDTAVTGLVFWITGFALMFGAGNDLFGTEFFFLSNIPDTMFGVPTLAFFFFQFAFSAAASTITTGAMAERTSFKADLVYSVLMGAVIYPIVGHWVWGGGWLAQMGFSDFAGSTVVHTVGGFAGLMGTLMLGPRLGKYTPHGAATINGHSMALAALGTFILWLGWYGFNPGSTLSGMAADSIALITVNTTLAACAGACLALLIGYLQMGSWQLPWALNGSLAGLVAVTAPCAWITPAESVVIGAVGGVVVYAGVIVLDRIRVDDPVSAIPVHAFCGIWGTLAVGLFAVGANGRNGLLHGGGLELLGIQAAGVAAVAAFIAAVMGVIFWGLKLSIGLRVPAHAETAGLDGYQHGGAGYPEFVPALIGAPSSELEMADFRHRELHPAAGD